MIHQDRVTQLLKCELEQLNHQRDEHVQLVVQALNIKNILKQELKFLNPKYGKDYSKGCSEIRVALVLRPGLKCLDIEVLTQGRDGVGNSRVTWWLGGLGRQLSHSVDRCA